MATRDVRNAPKDLDEQISRDFNTLIQKIYGELSTEQYSPVYTGFFASSWKIQTMGIKSVDRVQDFEPWASIKRNHDLPTGNEGWKPKGSRPSNPQIKPRFPITKTFNFKKPVFIGNRAEYAAYTLEGGDIQKYVQGQIGRLINETMREKKGKLFIGSRQTPGFGAGNLGVGYSEVQLKKL